MPLVIYRIHDCNISINQQELNSIESFLILENYKEEQNYKLAIQNLKGYQEIEKLKKSFYNFCGIKIFLSRISINSLYNIYIFLKYYIKLRIKYIYERKV